MRPLLLILFVALGLGRAWGEITVCASGCDVTSIANARATATATPNSVINVTGAITEDASLGAVNTSLTFRSSNGSTWSSTSAGALITVANTLLSPVSFTGINFNKSNANALFSWTGIGVGSSVYFYNCRLISSVGTSNVACSVALVSENQLMLDKCFLSNSGGGTAGVIGINAAITNPGSVFVKNCLINGELAASQRGIRVQTATDAGAIIKVYNTTIVRCAAVGIQSTAGGDYKNCILANPTDDLNLGTGGANSNFTYGAVNINEASMGTGSITITAPRTFCDQNNYYISPASLTLNAGVSINGVTGTDLGLNGVLQGAGGIFGMGCNPYDPSFCGSQGVGGK